MDNVSVVISEELDLNVLWLIEEAFNKDSSVTEGGLGLGGGSLKGLLQGGLLANNTHATATTTVCCLDDNWESVLVGKLLHILELVNGTFGTWNYWNTGRNGKFSGRNLVSKSVNNLWRWANKLCTCQRSNSEG